MDRTRIKSRRRLRLPYTLSLHPLFLAVGIWYAVTGNLMLFLMSCLVALQHECAHAFEAAKYGYALHKIVLMPFGAVIDGDTRALKLKDEISIALAGPICNFSTALFFAALWWFAPTMYAFTDTAYTISLSIALVNLLPAYPLDGGRVLHCLLFSRQLKKTLNAGEAERRSTRVCRWVAIAIACAFFLLFIVLAAGGVMQISALTFGLFILVGSIGNKDKNAVYKRLDFSLKDCLKTGVEIKKVAVLQTCAIKDAFKFISKEHYLILDVYDEQERFVFSVPQNQLSAWFLLAPSPYSSLIELWKTKA